MENEALGARLVAAKLEPKRSVFRNKLLLSCDLSQHACFGLEKSFQAYDVDVRFLLDCWRIDVILL